MALASCNMRTVYVRNVPDEVVERLEALAARAHMSLSAFVASELGAISRRADNPALLGALPDLEVRADDIVADLDHARTRR